MTTTIADRRRAAVAAPSGEAARPADVPDRLPGREPRTSPRRSLSTEGDGFDADVADQGGHRGARRSKTDARRRSSAAGASCPSRIPVEVRPSAAADAAMLATKAFGPNTTSASYTIKDVFFFGGKAAAEPETVKGERGLFDKAWRRIQTTFEPKNPPLYAAITVQKNETRWWRRARPPPATGRRSERTDRHRGARAQPGEQAAIPALFAHRQRHLLRHPGWMLHTRDKRAMAGPGRLGAGRSADHGPVPADPRPAGPGRACSPRSASLRRGC